MSLTNPKVYSGNNVHNSMREIVGIQQPLTTSIIEDSQIGLSLFCYLFGLVLSVIKKIKGHRLSNSYS